MRRGPPWESRDIGARKKERKRERERKREKNIYIDLEEDEARDFGFEGGRVTGDEFSTELCFTVRDCCDVMVKKKKKERKDLRPVDFAIRTVYQYVCPRTSHRGPESNHSNP